MIYSRMTEKYVFQNDKARLNLQLAKAQSNTVISAINFKSPKSRKKNSQSKPFA